MARRIGILGGTFNPVHVGHLALAEGALQKLRLDQVLWVLTPQSPFKPMEGEVSAEHRAHMVELAIQGNSSFELSRQELQRKPPYYFVDTAGQLRESEPDAEWVFLVGSDKVEELPQWHQWDRLLSLVRIFVIPRPGSGCSVATLPKGVELLELQTPDISSSGVRQRIKRGESIQGFVPEPVRQYIEEHGLYRGPGGAG